jgi:hypothetical protein
MTGTGHATSHGIVHCSRSEALASSPIVSLDLQKYKVLRILQAGQFNPPHLTRINKDSLRSALAVKGDVLIHGPNLVALSVGSERRNQHLHVKCPSKTGNN